ncbi:hypothetical protein SEMRO_742_G195980.1 [Seminavis robusta]|uniref:Uncharacterized protein n=1 Tax=Seminavis robusta TaxID=568900 RepID=A0A9N8EC75_9STRA|nr:hypothetical protein SEMRO_742_G195980.1 [Seminavis robusta]|eukprot:Sro742_g195980.1 n/a (241) ;mRNA; f:46878-47600
MVGEAVVEGIGSEDAKRGASVKEATVGMDKVTGSLLGDLVPSSFELTLGPLTGLIVGPLLIVVTNGFAADWGVGDDSFGTSKGAGMGPADTWGDGAETGLEPGAGLIVGPLLMDAANGFAADWAVGGASFETSKGPGMGPADTWRGVAKTGLLPGTVGATGMEMDLMGASLAMSAGDNVVLSAVDVVGTRAGIDHGAFPPDSSWVGIDHGAYPPARSWVGLSKLVGDNGAGLPTITLDAS